MKIVINRCFGGFGLSYKASMRYAELKGFKLYPYVEKRNERGEMLRREGKDIFDYIYEPYVVGESQPWIIHYQKKPLSPDGVADEEAYWYDHDIERNDPALIQVIEELGSKEASDTHAELGIVEIPDDVEYHIEEYDGRESIHEKHRSWS